MRKWQEVQEVLSFELELMNLEFETSGPKWDGVWFGYSCLSH